MASSCLLIGVFGKRNEESGGLAVDASPPDDLIHRLLDFYYLLNPSIMSWR